MNWNAFWNAFPKERDTKTRDVDPSCSGAADCEEKGAGRRGRLSAARREEPACYRGILRRAGQRVSEEEAFTYVLNACGLALAPHFDERLKDHRECRQALVEWFFSGSWMPAHDFEAPQDEAGI
jgi:hypothetical protein